MYCCCYYYYCLLFLEILSLGPSLPIRISEIIGAGFYTPDALSVTQPTV